ncbi:c-type cytochrome biogenesis protein CcsB [Streptomyces sp. 3MP-14]|uniref:C-type cytochrome biogenesis protein CcsB n=1 Tax=Streptomyces mimosae TaxID=2586635 RepID=A0A5N5ZTN7_9ACTN|nr:MULTISPECIES: c-type cytochrome biogenesis protein CcsB [Streptomyces]KAB8158328.1 c-type cytochrome biogenesis protein CcsB [Streptomyces mimosae]KAB8176863.1 c-type cytochrome biogenesis protein CcsB [Streptomyces sp. 3MP-14]
MMLAADQGLADTSNVLVYTAMAVYALAFLAYVAEWVLGGRSRVARTLPTLEAEDKAARGAASAGPAVTVRGRNGTSVLERPKVVTRSANPGRADVPDGPGAAGGDERGDTYGRIAVSLTTLAFLLHLGGVVSRAVAVERGPWGNMYEFSTAFSMVVTGAFLILLLLRRKTRWLGLIVVGTVLLDLGLATTVLYTETQQLVPALDSIWMWIHVPLAIVCGGLLYLGAISSVLFLFRDRYEAKLAVDAQIGTFSRSVLGRLPSSATLDRFAYRINAAVFPLWTFTIVAGAIWAEDAWGRYWDWDPKETWAFITWVAYACYLHARATVGWKGRKAAYLAVAGFLCFLVNYYGVNIFFDSLHSYGGV